MADEYRFSWLGTEVAHSGNDTDLRVSHLSLEVAHNRPDPSDFQISLLGLEVALKTPVVPDTFTLSLIALEVETTLRIRFSPDFIDDDSEVLTPRVGAGVNPDLFDESALEFPGFPSVFLDPVALNPPIVEWNPYRPDIPQTVEQVDPDLGQYLIHQAETIRQQHNLAQAGDSTFGLWLLTQVNPTKLYTLGSLGRFYDETYGILHARYIQFTNWVEGGSIAQPVGRIASRDSTDWSVTNDLSLSDPDLVVGVVFLTTTPVDGYYGWVVVDGINPAQMTLPGTHIPAPGESLVWGALSQVTTGEAGRVLGRVITSLSTMSLLPAGGAYIQLEGPSETSLGEFIQTLLADTITEVGDLGDRMDVAELAITTAQGTLLIVQTDLTELTARLMREEAARVRDINSLRVSITASTDWSSAIVAGDNVVRDEFRVADDALRVLISAAQYDAATALSFVSGLDVATVNSRLDVLDHSVFDIYTRLTPLTARSVSRAKLRFLSNG